MLGSRNLVRGILWSRGITICIYVLAEQRGHEPVRVQVKPSFANRHLWKTIYEYDDHYYVDAVKLLLDAKIIPGSRIKKLDVKRDFPWLPENSQQARDIGRFRWFSDDFLAVSVTDPNMVIDIRYSFLPNRIDPMWGVEVSRQSINAGDNDAHARYRTTRNMNSKTTEHFLDMLF